MRLAVVLAAIYATTSMPTPNESSESLEDEDDGESWECGTDAFSKYISENQIELDCPHLKKNVNGCCIKHDKCYDDQMGRKFCDDTFCSCLDVVTKGSDVCNKENGPLFCGMVRQFGLEAYLRSGNNTSSNITLIIEEQQQEPTNTTTTDIVKLFENDYESQVSVNDTIVENSELDGVDLLDSILKSHQL
uniref:Secretory peptide n=1 Tax=Haemonchus contortus TaxID=6289 RepID=A0A7I4XS90_HAECO|nr:Protein F35C11.5 [Haemonchus contortus]